MGFFQDSLKKWFYTNSSSAASSDARIPLLNANGTPKGSDTMVNIAGALGVAQFRLGPLVNKYFYSAPGQGNTIKTECKDKGLIVIQMNGTDSTSVYAGSADGFLTPISESSNIKLNGGSAFDVGVNQNFITVKQNISDTYAWNFIIIQVSYNGSLQSV